MKGYIYLITNAITKKQYVGQTIRTIEERFVGHKTSAKYHTDNTYLHKSMNKYGFENFKIEEIICIEFDERKILEEELNILEKYYIQEFDTLVPHGYNLTKGGTEGAELYKRKVDEYDLYGNYICTYDSIIDAARKLNVNSSAIAKCCHGKSKFAFQRIWRFYGDDLYKYALPSNIQVAEREYKLTPVDQYTIDGKYIKTFDSMVNACKELKLHQSVSHIAECCMGKLYTAYGFVWRYKGEPFDKYAEKDKRQRKCKLYDLEGNLINTFESVKAACFSINLDYKKATSHIISCCKGKRKSAYGYKWEYA